MKKELAIFTLALGLALTAPAFAGEEKITPKKQPVKMTEQQLDNVAGGLITIVAIDVVDVRTGDILRTVNVAANVSAAVLGASQAAQGVNFRTQ